MAKEYICRNCSHIGEVGGDGLRGNILVSNILWIFVLPGLLYSIWRRMGRKSCRNCLSSSVIKLSSKDGKMMMEEILLKNITK